MIIHNGYCLHRGDKLNLTNRYTTQSDIDEPTKNDQLYCRRGFIAQMVRALNYNRGKGFESHWNVKDCFHFYSEYITARINFTTSSMRILYIYCRSHWEILWFSLYKNGLFLSQYYDKFSFWFWLLLSTFKYNHFIKNFKSIHHIYCYVENLNIIRTELFSQTLNLLKTIHDQSCG